MHRVVLFVLFLVLLAGLVLPFWGGIEARRVYEDVVTQLDTQGGARFRARSEDYEHGWLSSTAHTRFWTEGTEPENGLRVDHTIHHGPYPFGLLLGGEIDRGAVAAVVDTDFTPELTDDTVAERALEGEPLIRLRAVIQLDGSANLTVHSPEFSLDSPPFEWRGASGEMVFPPGGTEGHGEVKAFGMNARFQDKKLDVGEFGFEFASEFSAAGLPLGRASAHLDHLRVANGRPLFHLLDASYGQVYAPQEEGELIDVTIESSLEEAFANDTTYGPATMRIVFRNLDPSAIVAYREAISRAAESEDPKAKIDEAVADLWPSLLAARPECEIETFRVEIPEGALDITGQLRLDESATALPGAMKFAAARGNLSVEIPPRLLHAALDRQVAKMKGIDFDEATGAAIVEIAAMRTDWIDQLLVAQLLEREDDLYFVDLVYEGQQFLVNGKPFDLSSLAVILQPGSSQSP